MTPQGPSLEQMDQEQLAGHLATAVRRALLHYGLWFNEVVHQLGLEEAIRTEEEVAGKIVPLVVKRLSRAAGLEEEGRPFALASLPPEKLIALVDAVSANWLAADGIWFQSVENAHDQYTAKRCNDACWARLSPLEARMIMSLVGIPENPGLKGLETALGYRLYARLNKQSTEWEGDALIFRMTNCRVQSARKSKNLPDYPCKSAGVTEYTTFARAIDPRIRTECIACPPDAHPDDWACAWRFSI